MQQVILWDWDNTLADTFPPIFQSQNQTRQHFGLPLWTEEESRQSMNHSGRSLFQNVFGRNDPQTVKEVYLRFYRQHQEKISLKPDAEKVLRFFKEKGFVNILASNKNKDLLKKEVTSLGVLSLFDKIVGAEECCEDKPSKIFTDYALMGLNPDQIWVVGDSAADMQMAKNYTNARGILVGSGVKNIGADFYCSTLGDVLSLIK